MKPGRQWLVFDADFFDNNFTIALLERFGPAGVALFMAFLCGCKRNHIQGRISYRNEWEALEKLGIAVVQLADNDGLPFTLDEFWEFTGKYKQTRRTRQGHTWNVFATGWEDWQQSKNRLVTAERKRRSRAEKSHASMGRDIDSDIDSENDSDGVTKSRKFKTQEPPAYPEWTPDTAVDESQPKQIRPELIASLLRKKVDG